MRNDFILIDIIEQFVVTIELLEYEINTRYNKEEY